MTHVGIISQARMTSTRLPGKVLLESGGATMLAHHVNRLRTSGYPVYVATTTNATDDVIVAESERIGVDGVSRGSEDDVLSRFAVAAEAFGLEVVVRVTSDCPLIDGDLIRRGVERFLELEDPRALVSNTIERTYPRGFDFEVFSAAMLHEADRGATTPAEREHVTPYLYAGEHPRASLHAVRREAPSAEQYRVTLDTPEDWTLIDALISTYSAQLMTGEQIINLLEAHPDLARINGSVEQKRI